MINEETYTILDEKAFSTISKFFKVLSNPTRISLMNILENKVINVGT